MSKSISISELDAARAKMTPGEWRVGQFAGLIYGGKRDRIIGGADFAETDRAGLVATHNAAPALIELAKAALALDAAEKAANEASLAWDGANAIACNKRERDCRAAYRAAIAKVRP